MAKNNPLKNITALPNALKHSTYTSSLFEQANAMAKFLSPTNTALSNIVKANTTALKGFNAMQPIVGK